MIEQASTGVEPPPPGSPERLARAFRAGALPMVLADLHGRVVEVNEALARLLGSPARSLAGGSITALLRVEGADRRSLEAAVSSMVRDSLDRYHAELQVGRDDGTSVWVDVHATRVPAHDGAGPLVLALLTDATERRRGEQLLREREAALRHVVDSAAEGIIVVDARGRIVSVNPQVERLFGYRPQELVGQSIELLIPERLRAVHERYRARHVAAHRMRPMGQGLDLTARRKDGSEFPIEVGLGAHEQAEHGEQGLITCVVADITARKIAEERLAHQATHDHLTGLVNRAMFRDRIDAALARAARRPGYVGVLFLDLDHFKSINDNLGHSAGDAVLTQVASRLRGIMRASDTVARFGGDEFAFLCEDLPSEDEAARMAQRIIDTVSRPIVLQDREVAVTPSVGIALATGPDTDPDTLLQHADAAMYRAKAAGAARFELFDQRMRARALERLEAEEGLRRAAELGELCLHYQPVVALTDGAIVGVEALLRWQRPGDALLLPERFLPLAQEAGLMAPLGAWALREACHQTARWRAAHPRHAALGVTVNLSAGELAQPTLLDVVAAALRDSGLPADALTLDIAESSLEHASGLDTLQALGSLGVRLSVDDFGSGPAPLGLLRRLPVDCIKIDGSLVEELGRDAGPCPIVAAVIALAHALGIPALAEGVEDQAQLDRLRALACDYAQGHLISPPLEAAEVDALLGRSDGGAGVAGSVVAGPLTGTGTSAQG